MNAQRIAEMENIRNRIKRYAAELEASIGQIAVYDDKELANVWKVKAGIHQTTASDAMDRLNFLIDLECRRR